MNRRFFLIPDNDTQQLYILCTRPLAFMLVKYEGLELITGEEDRQMLLDAEVFYKNFSSQKFELIKK